MSHTTPATYLIWAILSSLLGAFLVFHLWKYDKFKCLRWNSGPYSGAFKRIMTYTYLLDTPLLIGYSVGYTFIKYRVGWTNVAGFGIQPTPWQLWPESYQRWIFPLNLLFSIAWGFEMVTHLEELCFWLFLMNAGAIQQDWFRSAYFRTWIVGSISAVVYMPLVTIFTRSDPLKSEAYTFLAGSIGSLSLTLWFTPILFTFPAFLRSLRFEGVDGQTIVRLTKFHELNCIRVFFRFMFCIPLLILGIDGIQPHEHINDSMLDTELLAFLAALGCVISSGITLVIFFPRSIENEIEAKNTARRARKLRHAIQTVQSSERDSYFSLTSPIKMSSLSAAHGPDGGAQQLQLHVLAAAAAETEYPLTARIPEKGERTPGLMPMSPVPLLSPNRAVGSMGGGGGSAAASAGGGTVDVEGTTVVSQLTEQNLRRLDYQASSNVHPFVHNYTSPIDLVSRRASNIRWSAQQRTSPETRV